MQRVYGDVLLRDGLEARMRDRQAVLARIERKRVVSRAGRVGLLLQVGPHLHNLDVRIGNHRPRGVDDTSGQSTLSGQLRACAACVGQKRYRAPACT